MTTSWKWFYYYIITLYFCLHVLLCCSSVSVDVQMNRRLSKTCFVYVLETQTCSACLSVCLRFCLIIVRLIISAFHRSIITIKTFTIEECCASGVKVFSLIIWLELILWSASKNNSYCFTSTSNESSSEMNLTSAWMWQQHLVCVKLEAVLFRFFHVLQ